jgi:nucleoside-diphosphate-sugar epimerase
MTSSQRSILVTGAAGYLASWVVEHLLRQGHQVHGSVRSLADQGKVSHLQQLADTLPGTLRLFEADLLVEGSFDQAMQGCDAVIHCASPYFLEDCPDPETQLLQPAVQGTRNVLNSVNRCDSVRRVVLTSSVLALFNNAKDLASRPTPTVQESDINHNTELLQNPYAYSKTVAERTAWEMQKAQTRWDMVSIHPGAIFGPSLSSRADATSVGMLTQFLNGSFRRGVPRLWMGLVDVRDAAQAHVTAALQESASGRYIVVAETARLLEMAALMDVTAVGIPDRLPSGEAPKSLLWLIAPLIGLRRNYITGNVGYPLAFNNNRSQLELGIVYRSLRSTLNEHIQQIARDGLLK